MSDGGELGQCSVEVGHRNSHSLDQTQQRKLLLYQRESSQTDRQRSDSIKVSHEVWHPKNTGLELPCGTKPAKSRHSGHVGTPSEMTPEDISGVREACGT
ncbi:hypothetical protein EVAR_68822_1 [Eumeta japonica]|uniref:Uncharacterized protein n=1 Tax=Eumeta variegata TaxID=151549 RepID=A0A4C1YX21_EUMVA|nr:hypothetical protein EVAR_68822_1 [Eumeta japonica]